jgi:hypothetical protein
MQGESRMANMRHNHALDLQKVLEEAPQTLMGRIKVVVRIACRGARKGTAQSNWPPGFMMRAISAAHRKGSRTCSKTAMEITASKLLSRNGRASPRTQLIQIQ